MTPNNPVNHAKREHAHCSASGSDKWTECYGQPAICNILPPMKSSAYADEGTQAHELSDKIMKPLFFHYNKTGQLPIREFELIDFGQYDNYPREMFDYVRYGYCDLVFENVKAYKPKKVFIEQELTLSKPLQMFGTADCYFFFKHKGKTILAIFDLKYGKNMLVEADSLQLKYYAGAAYLTHKAKIPKLDEIWLNIYQPRAEHPSGEIHRQHVMTLPELEDAIDFLLGAGTECMPLIGKPLKVIEPHLSPGLHCEWCDATGICPAYTKHVNEKMGQEFDKLPENMPALLEPETDMTVIDTRMLSKLLLAVPQIERICRNAKKIAINLMLAGTELPGWKTIEGRTKRTWKKGQEGDVGRGLVVLGVSDPWKKSLRGIGEIEAELKSKKQCTKKAASKMIDHLVEKTEAKLTLALIDDPHPAITGDKLMAGEFDRLDVDESESFD